MDIGPGLESFVLRTHLKAEWIRTTEELRESRGEHPLDFTLETHISLMATV